jgi:hypothetical protein
MADNVRNQYFAALPPDQLIPEIESRSDYWNKYTISNSYIEKIRKSWFYYHGAFFERGNDHRISFGGDQGELVQFPINHYRNIALHMLNMTTAQRPAMQARASNTDYKSAAQVILANGLLDYYMREKRLEDYLRQATEYAIVFGEGYVKLGWNPTAGKVYEEDEETGEKYFEGDLEYTNLSPLDVLRDNSRENQDHDWLVVRSYKNRYDLIAKHPDLEQAIMGVMSKDDMDKIKFPLYGTSKTDEIPVFELFHRPTESLPDGRYVIYSSKDAVYYDGPLPYDDIPVYRIAPSNMLGTPYGYTILFDLMPIQEAINLLYSVILTNQNAFGVQNVLVPKGADINLTQIAGALNIIEYLPNVGKPEPMNLTQTPKEVFEMLEKLESTMETISGVNSVARGDPGPSLHSGAALALVQSQAVQFASSLQQSYVRLVENVGTAMIKILQRYAKEPRIAAIAGKSNQANMREFSSEDLSGINRVIVEIVNPLSRTTAGRLEIANQLLQMQMIKNPDQYFTVLNTGKLESMIEADQAKLLLIRSENEHMMEGKQVHALVTDDHKVHIAEHLVLLGDPQLREDPELLQLVFEHLENHKTLLEDPNSIGWLTLTNQQPLPPPGMMPGMAPPGAPGEAPPPDQGAPAPDASQAPMDLMQAPPTGAEESQNAVLPNMPKIPQQAANGLPTNPADNLPQ